MRILFDGNVVEGNVRNKYESINIAKYIQNHNTKTYLTRNCKTDKRDKLVLICVSKKVEREMMLSCSVSE